MAVRGPSRSGKTTLCERLVAELSELGLHVAWLKRTHHVDIPGKSSDRVWQTRPAATMLRATDRVVVTLRPATVSRVSWWRRFPASSTSSSSRRTRPCPSSQPARHGSARPGKRWSAPGRSAGSHCSAERGRPSSRSFRKTANWTVRSVRPCGFTAAMPVRAWCSEPASRSPARLPSAWRCPTR